MMKSILLILALGFAIAASDSGQARPVTPAEKRISPFSADLPACGDSGVLGTISSRFQQKEYWFWKSPLEIVGYDRVRESGFRTNGADFIPRRYCTARASLNNRRKHEVVYWIGERLGIIGASYGVEWCVIGLDRNDAFAPNCREARH